MGRIAKALARHMGWVHPFYAKHPEHPAEPSFEWRCGPLHVEEFNGFSFTVETRWFRWHQYPLRCAMHGAVNVGITGRGYLCFKPPTRPNGHWWPWYLYWSPNATPWAATWALDAGTRREIASRRTPPAPGAAT